MNRWKLQMYLACCLLSVGIAGGGGFGGSRNVIESQNPKTHQIKCVHLLPNSGSSTKGDGELY